MQTEAVVFQSKEKSLIVARSLQDLAPVAYQIIDDLGKPVSLSSAGFVLHSRKKYRLRIRVPQDGDLVGIQVISPPDFLKVERELLGVDEGGNQVHDIPFRVHLDLGVWTYLVENVRCDELEIHFRYKPESGKFAPPYRYPLVVRLGLWPIAIGFFVSVVTLLGPVLLESRFSGDRGREFHFWTDFQEWLFDPLLWLVVLILSIGLVVVYGFSLIRLYQRSKELTQVFREHYPSAKKAAHAEGE